ncbi:phosphate ABC transporter permease PstA [Streptacidiphilus jiangxiensis]|uniref:Phosphate transport system permease protein PstA n=1 Tax=Streptacidiphilus jiangxiensis TaxID=235985 RepID=A0A1H7LY51_STRJI|nr:phosphate ABC transporter permease PstA [Streptacidiphilus jiangxiensis]SEL03678.1 phosphate transport system permease protein [Streptacidiphilus jiangxiensis]
MATTTSQAPVESGAEPRPEAPAPAAPERRIRVGGLTGPGVASLLGALGGSLALTWLLYERILPLSGGQGFLLAWFLLFNALYFLVGRTQWDPRTARENSVRALAVSAGALVVTMIGFQIGFVAWKGWDAAHHQNFYTQDMEHSGALSPLDSGGAFDAIVGTLEQLGLATLFSVPLGIATAVYLSEVGGRAARAVRTVVEAMTALPSIVAGLFVLGVVILTLGLQKSGFAASLALSVMMMPIITRAAEVVLRLVPGTLREASYALGSSHWRTVWTVVLPTARRGLVTAVLLGMARGVGETSPVLLTSGFTSHTNWNPFSDHQVSLPLYIWNYVRQPYPYMVARGFAAAMALMGIVLLLFVTARLLGGRTTKEGTR